MMMITIMMMMIMMMTVRMIIILMTVRMMIIMSSSPILNLYSSPQCGPDVLTVHSPPASLTSITIGLLPAAGVLRLTPIAASSSSRFSTEVLV